MGGAGQNCGPGTSTGKQLEAGCGLAASRTYEHPVSRKPISQVDKQRDAGIFSSAAPLLLKAELATRLRVTPRTIENRTREGMPSIRVGSAVRYDYDQVLAWLKEPRKRSAGQRRPRTDDPGTAGRDARRRR